MGAGASCTELHPASLDERLRTMLILRSYNCRPRDWTMQEQFDTFADNGVITKDRLREALRLSECPRIEALLDRCLLHPPFATKTSGGTSEGTTTMSVSSLVSFIEGDKACGQILPSRTEYHQSTTPTDTTISGVVLDVTRAPMKATTVPQSTFHLPSNGTAEVTVAVEPTPVESIDINGGCSPPVVPLVPKSVTTATSENRPFGGSRVGRYLRPGVRSCDRERKSAAKEGVDNESSGVCVRGPCTTLVRHLGTVLGFRGKEAYRRPGTVQPVWRKKETLIQERIVQYTTLDEEGTVQELVETEKSQTEVLHMECKRTGEFAHRESTHYESGETFNGEVVLEEAGAEHYVHLRSVDDEYENLESTLPPHARQGGTGGAGTAAGADGDTVRPPTGAAGNEAESTHQDGDGTGTVDESRHGSRQEEETGGNFNCPNSVGGDEGRCDEPTSPSMNMQRNGGSSVESVGEAEGAEGDRIPTAARRNSEWPQHTGFHYRSPNCSPRLSPRPARSPYRQEGVGGRESSGRFGSERRDAPTPAGGAAETSSFKQPSGDFDNEIATKDKRGEQIWDNRVHDRQTGTSRVDVEGAVDTPSPALWEEPDGEVGAPRATMVDREIGKRRARTAQVSPRDRSGLMRPRNVAGDILPWENMSILDQVDVDGDGNDDGEGSVDSVAADMRSVMFFDNGSLKDDESIGIEDGEAWHEAEALGSGLRGLEFAFGEEDGSVVLPTPGEVERPSDSPVQAEGKLDPTSTSEEPLVALTSAHTSRLLNRPISDYLVDATPDGTLHGIGIGKYNIPNDSRRRGTGIAPELPDTDSQHQPGTAAPFYGHSWDRVAE